MKKKVLYISFPILFFLIFLSSHSFAYILGDDKGNIMKGNILYSSDGKAVKEFVRDENGEIIRTFVFTDYDKYGMIEKADIYDYNEVKEGTLEFLYKKGALFRVDQKDQNGNIVKRSYIQRENDSVSEYITGDKTWDYIREYNLKDKNYIRIQKKENIEKTKEIFINGEKYYSQRVYDLENRATIEYLKDEDKNLILKYIFISYDDEKRVKRAEVKDRDDAILVYMDFKYSIEGELKDVIYYDRDGKLIAKSDIKVLTERLIEYYNEFETNKSLKISYEIDNKVDVSKEER